MNPAQKLKTISALPALTPLETLRLVASSVQSLSSSDITGLVKVTLYLAGASFTGFVVGIRDESEGSYVLFVEHDDARGQSINIVYLPVWAVIAVKVHEADQYLHLLSGGKVETQKTTLGIATLRNKITDEVVRLRTAVQVDIKLEVSWETLAQDDLTLLGLYELIDIFMSALQETIVDEFRKIVFKHSVTVIRFQNSADAEIHQEGQTLTIRANLKERSNGRFNREEFKAALTNLTSTPDN